jgi:hypothetical protein
MISSSSNGAIDCNLGKCDVIFGNLIRKKHKLHFKSPQVTPDVQKFISSLQLQIQFIKVGK